MAESMLDPRMKIFAVIFGVLMLGAALFVFAGDDDSGSASGGAPKLSIVETDYDFGDISMAKGLAKHEFTIRNEGDAPLVLTGLSTSCACTKVVLVNNGKRSPEFGMQGHGVNPLFWSDKIESGQSAVIEATFNPLAHGPDAVGPITRDIIIYSNNGGKKNAQSVITFSGNVIK